MPEQKMLCATGLLLTAALGFLDAVALQVGATVPEAVLGSSRFRHHNGLHFVCYSPKGDVVVSSGADDTVRFWDSKTGTELRSVRHPDTSRFSPFCRFCLARDGETLVVSEASGIWVYPAGRPSFQFAPSLAIDFGPALKPLRSSWSQIALSDDQKRLAALDSRNALKVWDFETKKELFVRKFPFELATQTYPLAFSPDSQWMAFVSSEGAIEILDLRRWVSTVLLRDDRAEVSCLAFVGNDWVAVAKDGIGLAIWDKNKKTKVWEVEELADTYISVALRPDGATLALGTDRGRIELRSVLSGRRIQDFKGSPSGIADLAFSPDGKTLAFCGEEEAVRFLDLAKGREIQVGNGHRARVQGLAFLPDKLALVSASLDGSVKVWDTKDWREVRELPGNRRGVNSVACSRDGKYICSAGRDGMVRVWNTRTKREVTSYPADAKEVYRIVYWDTAHKIISFGIDGIGVFDLSTMGITDKIASEKQILHIHRLSDQDNLLICQNDEVRILRLTDKRVIQTMTPRFPANPPVFGIGGCNVSTDGRYVVLRDYRNKVAVHERRTGEQVCEGQLPESASISPIAFVPEEFGLLVSGDQGGRIHVLNAASGKIQETIPCGSGEVLCFAFGGPEGKWASGHSDSTIRIWSKLPTAKGKPGKKLGAERLEELWNQLASSDAPKAYKAIGTLAQAPEDVVPFFERHLRAAADVDKQRIEQWIKDLNSEHFAVREKAGRELQKLGAVAEEPLRKAARDNPPLQSQRVIEKLLETLAGPITLPHELQAMRAVEVLEYIGSDAACALLRNYARGHRAARLTQEAKWALERLKD